MKYCILALYGIAIIYFPRWVSKSPTMLQALHENSLQIQEIVIP